MRHDSFAGSTTRHGTPSGWAKHQKLGEGPCDACRRAKADYDRRRLEVPANVAANRLHARAQAKASVELRAAHPEQYREAYTRWLAALKEEA